MSVLYTKVNSLFSYRAFRIFMGIVLIFACAQVSIPLNPVPITLHTVGILILALCYQKKEALSAIIGFIFLGAIGMPVFSSFSGGFSILIGPKGGYIIGMVLCIYIVTTLREKLGEESWIKLIVYSLIGSSSIYMLGIPQLALFVGWDRVLELGLYPFIIPGIIKALFTTSTVKILKGL